jgi:predicted 3-demethylubiquinone-9 3-methyltransferase (glyoxalase superfamily)
MQKITPFLWFDKEAEQAANHYVSIFKNAKITAIERYPDSVPSRAGSVMTVEFELAGQKFTAINGGPQFKFDEAISFVIDCKDQAEVDYYWERLLAGGGKQSKCAGKAQNPGGCHKRVDRRGCGRLPAGSRSSFDERDQSGADDRSGRQRDHP